MPHEQDLVAVRERLAAALGSEAYNRLVASVPDVRKRGRLRFWQEQLFRQASHIGVNISTADEFVRVFDGANPVPVPAEPWTRERFLRRIEEHPHRGFPLDQTPTEWMAAAWEIERVRDELSGEMTRTVSKTGELGYTKEWLQYLSRSLPLARQVELFRSIRDSSNQHREVEFRPGFEAAFPDAVRHLPPPLTVTELAASVGMTEEVYSRQFLNPNGETFGQGGGEPFEDDDVPS